MIRQAISCDICGAEKKQTNLWFVAYHQAGELRVSGWNSRNRLRAESKHLCGQTCLHRLVDEFFARTVANRSQTPDIEVAVCAEISPRTDTSLTSNIAHVSIESSERIVAPSIPALPQHSPVPQTAATQPALVALPTRLLPQDPRPASATPIETFPNYSSQHWRAEAWQREREREMRAVERRPDSARRRKSS